MDKVFFVRPGADLSKVHLTAKGANERVIIDGKQCEVFGNAKWTAIRVLDDKPKTARKAKRA